MSTEENKTNELEYFLSEKGTFLVVSFNGSITKSTVPALEKCQGDVLNSQAQSVVLNLHDVTKVDLSGIPPFALLQHAIRKKPAKLRLCFIKADFAKLLLDRVAIRREEVTANLKDALESLKKLPH